jgi:hypothetical protein
MSAHSTFELIGGFQEIWCEYYAIKSHPNVLLINFLQSVITKWLTHSTIVAYHRVKKIM